MIFILKKKSFFVLIFVVISAIILSSMLVNINIVNLISNDKFTVIVDAGHGGEDGGAVGIDNILEKDLNLLYAKDLKSYLEFLGYNVIMTRETDTSIHDLDAKTIREKKSSDLHNRLKITESVKNALLISIHMNKYREEKYSGSQIFFGGKNEKSKTLAEIISKNFKLQVNPENNRETKQVGKEIFLIYNSDIPTVLIECGFISNKNETELLKTKEYREKMMMSVALSVMEYEKSLGELDEN